MSLLPNITYANLETPLWAAAGSGGGGGGGSQVNTSSITVSTITASGTVESFISGDPTKLAFTWSVQQDGANNSADILSAGASSSAYRDVRISDGTGAPLEVLREQIVLGFAELAYSPDPTATAETGLRFLSSLNNGPAATAVITASDYFPLGNTVIPFATLSAEAPAGSGAVLTGSIPVVPGHLYNIAFQVSEAVTGVPNAVDRVSYTIAGQVLDTIPHAEISTLQGENPRGRCVTGVFVPPTNTVQLAVSNNSLSLESTIVTCIDTYLTGVALSDMGPSIVLP